MQTDRDWAKAKFNFSKTAPDYFFSTVPKEFFKLHSLVFLVMPIEIYRTLSSIKLSTLQRRESLLHTLFLI